MNPSGHVNPERIAPDMSQGAYTAACGETTPPERMTMNSGPLNRAGGCRFFEGMIALTLTMAAAAWGAPGDFTVTAPASDEQFALSQAEGKVVVLHFLLPGGSEACREHVLSYAPHVKEFEDIVHVFLKPGGAETVKAWVAKLEESKPAGPQYELPPIYADEDSGVAKAFDVPFGLEMDGQMTHYPALIALDAERNELLRHAGGSAQDRFSVERFLNEIEERRQASEAREQFNVNRQGVAVQGYDPVAYFKEGEAVKGTARCKLGYRGVIYLFENQVNRARFASDPEKYQPAYGGWCAASMAIGEKKDVDPKNFAITGERLFLFSGGGFGGFGNPRRIWEKKKAELIEKADEHWERIQSEPE